MVRARKRRKEMIKKIIFILLSSQPRHFVLHIPNTPPHHHLLLSKNKNKTNKENKKTQTEKDPTAKKKFIDEREKIQILRKKTLCEMPDQSLYDSEHQVIKFEKQLKRDGVFLSKKQK